MQCDTLGLNNSVASKLHKHDTFVKIATTIAMVLHSPFSSLIRRATNKAVTTRYRENFVLLSVTWPRMSTWPNADLPLREDQLELWKDKLSAHARSLALPSYSNYNLNCATFINPVFVISIPCKQSFSTSHCMTRQFSFQFIKPFHFLKLVCKLLTQSENKETERSTTQWLLPAWLEPTLTKAKLT